MAKGMSIDECVEEAHKFISERGKCLLLFDVKGSRDFDDLGGLPTRLLLMMEDLNQRYGEYFPEHELAVYSRKEKGFMFLMGDGSWTGISSADIIPEIIEYQRKKYPDIPLYWGVARDGYDRDRTNIVR